MVAPELAERVIARALARGGDLGSCTPRTGATSASPSTIAGDLVGMLRDVLAVGSEDRWIPLGGSVRAAPLLIGEMAMSGS